MLKRHFGLESVEGELPESAGSAADVYRAVVRAWSAVNRRIRLGRGSEFEIGHGILMQGTPPDATATEALEYIRPGWRRLRQHLDDFFFGSADSLGAALNVDGSAEHPIRRETELFANDSVTVLIEPNPVDDETLYKILRAVAG